MKNKWGRNKDRLEEKKNKKQYRIYLQSRHDYFGVADQQKIRERQRLQKAEEANGFTKQDNKDVHSIIGIGTEPSRPWSEEDLRILRRSIVCQIDHGRGTTPHPHHHQVERRPSCSKIAISVPLREVLTAHIKSYFHRLTRWKVTTNSTSASSPRMDQSSLLMDSPRSMRSRQSRTTSTSTTFSTDSDFDQYGYRRHVHFAPDTVFCERDDKSPFWTSLLQRRRLKAQKLAEQEEANRPRPLLPFLEAGLSYTNDEEFYRLKNISAHKDPQLILQDRKRREGGRGRIFSWPPFIQASFRRTFCCVLAPDKVTDYYHGHPGHVL